MQRLSVILPAYNEEKRIGKTLEEVAKFLSSQLFEYEIIVVNDGSKDGTANVVTSRVADIKNLKLIDNKENHGKGWVVKQGMLAATGDIRLFMDADNSTTVSQVMAMLPYFEQGYDVVVGSRRMQGAVIAVHQAWLRDFLGFIFRLIVRVLVPVGVADSQCGFKAFSAGAAVVIFPKQVISRWSFDAEILAISRKMKFKIKEVPVTWVNDSESHMNFLGMAESLWELIRIRLNLWFGKY